MKKLFWVLAVVVVLAACSKEETVVMPESMPIAFDNAFVNNETRATDCTNGNLENFGVYASVTNAAGDSGLIFVNELVKRENGKYVYDNLQYWVPGNTYNFVALAPGVGSCWTYRPMVAAMNRTFAQNGVIEFMNDDAAASQDLVFSHVCRELDVNTNVDQKAVALTFNHLLSRVAFKFENKFAESSKFTFKVYGVTITNAASDGEIFVANGVPQSWEMVGTETFERTFGEQSAEGVAIIAAGKDMTTEHFYLIPVEKEYTVKFKVDLYQAGVFTKTYEHEIDATINFAKGGSYSVKAALDQDNVGPTALERIEFEVDTVNGWDPNGLNINIVP